MKSIQLVIFDLAGTTVHDTNTVGQCLQHALESAGLAVSVDEVNAVMGYPKPEAIRILLEQRQHGGTVEAIHTDFQNRMIETYRTSPEIREIEGASETFRELNTRGYRIAVDTGFDRPIVDVLLGRLPWEGLVDDSITSDEVERGRPHPDMALELCRRAGVDPAHAAKVGDTPSDIQEGRAAGCGMVIATLYGTHTLAQLEPFAPDAYLSDIRELLTMDL